MTMELRQSPVVFDAGSHTYTLGTRELSGITSMLGRQLFTDKYDGVNQDVLRSAAARGSLIHSQCEMADRMGIISNPLIQKYVDLCSENGLHHIESEYLVSDEQHFASCIDKVFKGEDENSFWLGDIKTTYHLDTDYLRWQLSVYAYLFELQNPWAKVTRLYGIWLRDETAKLPKIERIDAAVIKELLEADAEGRQFTSPLPLQLSGEPLPAKYAAIEDTIISMAVQYDTLGKRLDELKAAWQQEMDASSIKKFQSERIRITRKSDTETTRFDTKGFEKDYPDLFKQYLKKATRKGGVQLTIL